MCCDFTLAPLVSAIIPTLNEEKYLEGCLVSLKNQSGDFDLEIIVTDGGSVDNTLVIAKKYADKVVISDIRGPSVQRNFGARIAQGEILVFIDADTVASKDLLKNFVETFKDKYVVGVIGPIYPLEKIKMAYLYTLTNAFQKFLVKINYPLFWGASCGFRRSAFWEINGFDTKLNTSEDHDISLRIKNLGKIVFNDKILAFTSHRRFIQNENKTFYFYIKDIIDFFLFRNIVRKISSKLFL